MAKAIKIVRKDKIESGYNGNLESVIIYNGSDVAVETSNGVFVTIGDLEKVSNSGEVVKGVLGSEATKGETVVLIHNPEVMYDERLYKLEDYVIEAGHVSRGYHLTEGDIITLTEDLFANTVAVGDKLIVHTDGLLGKPALPADADDAKVVFKVIEDSGNQLHQTAKAFAVKVIKA